MLFEGMVAKFEFLFLMSLALITQLGVLVTREDGLHRSFRGQVYGRLSAERCSLR